MVYRSCYDDFSEFPLLLIEFTFTICVDDAPPTEVELNFHKFHSSGHYLTIEALPVPLLVT